MKSFKEKNATRVALLLEDIEDVNKIFSLFNHTSLLPMHVIGDNTFREMSDMIAENGQSLKCSQIHRALLRVVG